MSIEDAIARIEKLERELPARVLNTVQVEGLDLVASIVDRVIETGNDAEGDKFTEYSTRPAAAWRFIGKSATQAAERKVRTLAKNKGSLSYAEFRRLNNRPTDFKNFSFTGQMWRDFGVIGARYDGTNIVLVIGGKTPDARRKIADNSKREGISIIKPSPAELQKVSLAIVKTIEQNV